MKIPNLTEPKLGLTLALISFIQMTQVKIKLGIRARQFFLAVIHIMPEKKVGCVSSCLITFSVKMVYKVPNFNCLFF